MQRTLGFHMVRIGVLLHEREAKEDPPPGGQCWSFFWFGLIKREKIKTLSAPCSLPHYQAGKKTQYTSKQLGNSRPLFRVSYLRKKHFFQGESGKLTNVLVT